MNTKNYSFTFQAKQRGTTLFSALVFLTLMTVVSVSAAKIASIDAIVSGNNQQQMLAFQQTDKTLKKISNPVVVVTAIQTHEGVVDKWTESVPTNQGDPSTLHAVREIKNRVLEYPCQANGMATSVGSDTAPVCYLFDLSSEDRAPSSNIKDKHFRGAGKSLPNTSNYTPPAGSIAPN